MRRARGVNFLQSGGMIIGENRVASPPLGAGLATRGLLVIDNGEGS
jgi:hypothetical protein